MPGKIGELTDKAFGNSVYSKDISKYEGINYQRVGFRDSIARTEGNARESSDSKEEHSY